MPRLADRDEPGSADGGVEKERCRVMMKSAAESVICAAKDTRKRIAKHARRLAPARWGDGASERGERSIASLSLSPSTSRDKAGIGPSTSRSQASDQMAYAPPDHPPLQYETRPVNFRDRDESDEYPPHSTQSPDVATTFTGYTSGITVPYSGPYLNACTPYQAHLFLSRVRIRQRARRDESTGSSLRVCPQKHFRNSTRPAHPTLFGITCIRGPPARFAAW